MEIASLPDVESTVSVYFHGDRGYVALDSRFAALVKVFKTILKQQK